MRPNTGLEPQPEADRPDTLLGFRLTNDPRSARWGVPTAAPGLHVALIGWVVREPAVDAGVPPQAVALLAQTLTGLGVLSFLGQESGVDGGPPDRQRATGDGGPARWRGASLRGPSPPPLPTIATRDAATARALFLSDRFDWTQQAQIGVLRVASGLEGSPAGPFALDPADLRQAIDRREMGELLRRRGWLGLVYPGADGDFLALVSRSPAFLSSFQDRLSRDCREAGLALQAVDEADFERLPWIGQQAGFPAPL